MLNRKIEELKRKIITMASITEESLEKAIKGLVDRDKESIDWVLFRNEEKINALELEIDDFCINLIARFQPEALYLRIILMALKINNDLERIGDLASNIAISASSLIGQPKVKEFVDLPLLADEVKDMQKKAIESFINGDALLAREVLAMDDRADNLRDVIIADLVEIMKRDSSVIERAIELIRITRNLERIADLSTNICEDVIYIVEGRVIKHGNLKDY